MTRILLMFGCSAGKNAPEASALHRLLRYPSQEQLAVRAAGQLHVVITGGAYTSLPLTIPNNTRITVGHAVAYWAAAHACGDHRWLIHVAAGCGPRCTRIMSTARPGCCGGSVSERRQRALSACMLHVPKDVMRLVSTDLMRRFR